MLRTKQRPSNTGSFDVLATCPRHTDGIELTESGGTILCGNHLKANSPRSLSQLAALEKAIKNDLDAHNKNTKPFQWTATADLILERVKNVCKRTSYQGMSHSDGSLGFESNRLSGSTSPEVSLRGTAYRYRLLGSVSDSFAARSTKRVTFFLFVLLFPYH